MKPNSYLLKSTVVAALGGLLFGFDTAVISGTTQQSHAGLPPDVPICWASRYPAALLGTIIGAMFAGIPGDKYGRRDSLRVMAVLYVTSACMGCAFAWNWSALVFFRFIGGLGIGGIVRTRPHVHRGDCARELSVAVWWDFFSSMWSRAFSLRTCRTFWWECSI